jgi:hypothetical protein
VRASLVRIVAVDPALGVAGGPGAVCLPCHGGDVADLRPARASAARLVFAPGGAPRAHASDKGCLLCHGGEGPRSQGVPDGPRGAGHAFKPQASSCAPCHAGAPPVEKRQEGRDVATHAADLWRELALRSVVPRPRGGAPPHASPADPPSGPLADVARKVALVLEDPAAGVHNAAYARALLDEATQALAGRR